jgi:hypothetical protein
MMIVVTGSMRIKQKEVIEGKFVKPLNAYKDKALTRID